MKHSKKLATGALSGLLAVAAASGTAYAGADKVTICHNTHSSTNPVVYITVSWNAYEAHVYNPGHNGGDLLYDGEGGCYFGE